MQDKKSCVIYCRQSVAQQNNNSPIKNQKETLKTIANERNLEVKMVFESLGTNIKIKELVEWINKNKVDYLLVTGIDRLCRDDYSLSLILNLLVGRKIERIITPEKDIDQTDLIPLVFAYLFREKPKKKK